MNNSIYYTIRAVGEQDRDRVLGLIQTLWGDERVIVKGRIYYPHKLPGFLAWTPSSDAVGLITFQIRSLSCQIITLNSLVQNQGVGTKLIERVLEQADRTGCNRVSLTTTNDNQQAISFYQNRGFRLSEIRKGAVDISRSLKPSIPQISARGIPIRDEWEFELILPHAS